MKQVGELVEGARGDEEYPLKLEGRIRTDLYVVLSQCCDLRDRRILVAPLVSDRMINWNSLGHAEARALRANQLGVEPTDEEDGVVAGTTADGSRMRRIPLVLPGFFHFAPLGGFYEEARVCHFAMAKGVRKDDFLALDKVAEMTTEARDLLRQRLAVFFGRVPDEDL